MKRIQSDIREQDHSRPFALATFFYLSWGPPLDVENQWDEQYRVGYRYGRRDLERWFPIVAQTLAPHEFEVAALFLQLAEDLQTRIVGDFLAGMRRGTVAQGYSDIVQDVVVSARCEIVEARARGDIDAEWAWSRVVTLLARADFVTCAPVVAPLRTMLAIYDPSVRLV